MIVSRFRVAQQKNQTNSNLLGMVLAQQCARALFFWGGPARKIRSVQALKPASARARKSEKVSSGWARPEYTNRHPQPPAKDIGLNGISQEHYCRTLRQSAHCNVQGSGIYWDC